MPVVHAPYNFVPFSTKILEYKDDIPAHNAIDPKLKTGEIHVTLTAQTPVFVSNGEHNAHFFRGPNGKIQISGSTIRGMVRQNMQILGFGLVRPGEDIQDKRFFYRKLDCPEDTVFYNLKKHYDSVLEVTTIEQDQKIYSVPQRVQGGYLRKNGDKYLIQPVKGKVLRVSREHPDVQVFGTEPSRAFPVSYTKRGDHVELIRLGTVPGMEHGFLLYTGKPVGEKPNPLYLFPEADEEQQPVDLEEDALINATDLELRKNFLRGGGHDPNFWKLPKSGETKPVFYARWKGHTYFGMSLFLRLRYLNSVADGLPKEHKDKLKLPDFLDWPRAILGWAGDKKSYRSRVSFGDFYAQGATKKWDEVTVAPGEPKPSYFPSYLQDGKHYDEDGFLLRGYKQYWLKEEQRPTVGRFGTTLRPLPAGTQFAGVISYKNLRPEELGLLLWAIRLEEDCYQSIGMGKPYGYGRMKVSINELREFDIAAMYCPEYLCATPTASSADAVQRYINAYDAAAAEAMCLEKTTITSTHEIQDFFFLKRTIQHRNEVGYMSRFEHENADSPLPAAADFRKKAEEATRSATAAAAAKDYSLEALAKHFNSKRL